MSTNLEKNEKNEKNEKKENNLLNILKSIANEKSYKNISEELNIAVGTVKRWIELENVPVSYEFELMKLANLKIDYSKYSSKQKDQFYTKIETAHYCYQKFLNIISNKDYNDIKEEINYTYIEPSVGSGNFLEVLPKERTIGIDIEPRCNNVIQADYLDWMPENDDNNNKFVVFGNPPFGLRGQLALKFINHSSKFADYVCFILPQLFESDGKGVPRKRVKDFNLIHSEKLNTFFLEPNGKEIKINCIFQIWSKYHENKEFEIKEINTDVIKIYSLSDGGTPSTTRNKNMFYNCDLYLPSTCFGKDNMRYHEKFSDLPRKKGYGIVFNKNKEENIIKFKNIKWYEIAFLSTNSAYNIRSSQIADLF